MATDTQKPVNLQKTGRRGDPRMHRAVAARLADPNMPLYDALKLGGFEYPADDDASCVDSEKVTLGQRKNQLSRRLRLTKKQKQQEQQGGGYDSVDMRNSCTGSTSSMEQEEDSKTSRKRALWEGEANEDTTLQQEATDRSFLMAKFHPDYHPILVPPHLVASSVQPNGEVPLMAPQSTTSGMNTVSAFTVNVPSVLPSNTSASAAATNPAASGVAIASLNHTANSVGLTLEQLAVTLSSSSNLVQVLNRSEESKREMALNIYQNESRALYTKCMLLAGYPPSDAKEGARKQVEFAFSAWELEGQRLQAFTAIDEQQLNDAPMEAKTSPPKSPEAAHSHSQESNDCAFDPGRHVHRLEGKCGHKAILHQPAQGMAHIDFVVGDKVECYQGIQPAGSTNAASIGVWPSKYKCHDLSCQSQCQDEIVNHKHSTECTSQSSSKIYELQDIDLASKEWNSDFDGQFDQSVLGLFKLGEKEAGVMGSDSMERI